MEPHLSDRGELTLRELKELAAACYGPLVWQDAPHFGGCAVADLGGGRWISLMSEPPGNAPQAALVTVRNSTPLDLKRGDTEPQEQNHGRQEILEGQTTVVQIVMNF